jgi:hypothetical protein
VILTDGQDPLIGIGNNVCFCYDDMQWTTGDASGGVGGFGGSPATVGANEGNGVDFFQVGVFDHAGVDYDGPGGLVDGVSFLDESTICFNVSGMDPNVPPIFLGAPIGCLTADVGMDLMFDIDAIGPEVGQTVTLTVDSGGLANFACVLTPGNPATAACTFSPTVAQIGMHMITLTATDNGAPPLSAEIDVCLEVPCPGFFNNYCVGLAGTGGVTPLIAGTGCPIPGANITVDVTAGRSLALGCLLMSRTEASMPFYGGTLCVGFPTLIVRVHRLNAAGERTFPFTIPNDAGLIGETASFQSFYVDDGAASGISMTDGLRMNIGG